MTPDELRALADALEPMAKAPCFEDFDVPAFCAWVRAQADAKPVGWLHHVYLGDDLVDKAMLDTADPAQVPLGPNEVVRTVVPIFLHPAPQPQPEPRPCTCHPDDNPPVPCARQYALNECRAASEPTEVQIEPKQVPLSDEQIAEIKRAAYERAAQECEKRAGPIEIYNRAYPHYLECASAIRALGRQHDRANGGIT